MQMAAAVDHLNLIQIKFRSNLNWENKFGRLLSGTNMQMAEAVDHLQRHHLRQQAGHDQASNE